MKLAFAVLLLSGCLLEGCMTINYSKEIKLISLDRANPSQPTGSLKKSTCYVLLPPGGSHFNGALAGTNSTLNNVKLTMKEYVVPYGVIRCPHVEAGKGG